MDGLFDNEVSGEPHWLPFVLKLILFLVGLCLFIYEALQEEPSLDLMFVYGWIMGLPGVISIKPSK